jgi:molybdopterin synthase catalytic subunit
LTRRLTRSRLSIAAASRELEGAGLGGVVVFSGRVRAERHGARSVTALDYEVHLGPALEALARIDREARARFGVRRTVLWHRIGRVPANETAVIVGAAAGHRAPAFEAARFLIDRLKETVPLWKVEQGPPVRRRPRRPRRPGGRRSG